MGGALVHQGRAGEAIALLERALALYSTGDVAPRYLARTRELLGRALRVAGREPERARALLEQARDTYRELGTGASAELARVEAELAAAAGHGRPAAHR